MLWVFFKKKNPFLNNALTLTCFQFGLYLSVNLSEPQEPNLFTKMYRHQQATLENVEEEEGANERVHVQVTFQNYTIIFTRSNQYTLQQSQWRTAREHLVFRAYNTVHHTLSTADIGRFLLAIVELQCNDIGHSSLTFSRVIFLFFILWV